MTGAEQVIAIILSAFLAIFLIAGIVLLVLIIKLTKSIKKVVDKAENVIQSAESITDVFHNVSGPLALMKMIANIMKKVNKGK